MRLPEEMPCFYGAIVIEFSAKITDCQIRHFLGENFEITHFKEISEVVYKEVKDVYCWEVNDLLTKLFCDCNFDLLLIVKEKIEAKLIIDISFLHKIKYPALVFNGTNMSYIHMLNADLSIDPY